MVPSNLMRGLQQKHIHCIKQNCTYFQSTSSLHKFALMIRTVFSGGSSVQIWAIFLYYWESFSFLVIRGTPGECFSFGKDSSCLQPCPQTSLGRSYTSLPDCGYSWSVTAMHTAPWSCAALGHRLCFLTSSTCVPQRVRHALFLQHIPSSNGAPSPRTEVGSLRTKKKTRKGLWEVFMCVPAKEIRLQRD